MTRYLFDTNIVSNFIKPARSDSLVRWLNEQVDEDLFIASLTLAEIQRGLLIQPIGKRRRTLEIWFTGPDGPKAQFAGRILPFDDRAAPIWAQLMADGKAEGRPRNAFDMILAAVALANNCIVVTDNERDFIGLESINPLRAP